MQVQQRYAELEDCYGFFCQCLRCKAEFDSPDEVAQLLNDILTKVGTEVGSACAIQPSEWMCCRQPQAQAASGTLIAGF